MEVKTTLYQITETSQFMMGFVIVTKAGNAIVIDGVCNAAGLAEANKTRDWLDAVLQTQNIRDIRDIFLLSVTDSGKLTLIRQADVQKGGKA